MAHRKRIELVAATLALCGATACGGGNDRDGGGVCPPGLLPGDLIITEIMANPPGEDTGFEWFEIYNATSAEVDMAGVVLAYQKLDGGGFDSHTISGLTIPAGGYVAVGDRLNEPDVLADYLAYGYSDELGPFRNGGAQLGITCDGETIDEATWVDATDSASRAFDGSRTPDAAGNDELASWCDSRTPFLDDQLGTPGAPNDACAGASSCTDDGVRRDIVSPQIGDLVITEFHPNPSAVGDTEGEWFEIYATAAVDLNGLQLYKEAPGVDEEGEPTEPEGTVELPECLSVEPGSYTLLARSNDPAVNGGMDNVSATFSFSLSNSDAGLYIASGGELLDGVTWSGSSDGAATNLDPDRFDPDQNDDEASFCDAETPYGDGDLGTPGGPNIECAIAPPEGQCNDGGELRDTVAPGPGDLVITEFMANPAAVDDDTGEWFEIRANGSFDINGLELYSEPGMVRETLAVEDCVSVSAGDHVVIARTDDSSVNGDLPQVAATFGFALRNSNGYLAVGIDGTVLDEFNYASTVDGAATSLDGSFTDPADNDDEANWCTATDSYGDGDFGTPGSANGDCGSTTPGTCDDGGTERDVVSPGVGELVITEFLTDPSGTDGGKEYFEVLALADVDLNGLQLGRDEGDVEETLAGTGPCLSVSNGDRIVFAGSANEGENGGIADVFAEFGFSLNQENRGIWLGIDGTTIDVVTYSSTTASTARSLDPTMETATANDDQGNFCDATSTFGDGDFGTPGAPNDACVAGDTCLDGGTPRAIVSPGAGDLVINEYMANPEGADSSREWFEVRIAAAGNVDLNGLELYHTDTMGVFDLEDTIDGPDCLTFGPNDLVLFARDPDDAVANGGLPAGGFAFNFSLVHTSDRGIAVGIDGSTLDEVRWTGGSGGNITEGASRTLGSGFDDTTNDNEANWCDGSTMYGDGGNGTPGAANDVCS